MTPSMYLIRLDTKARMEEQNTRATLQERNALSQCHLEPASAIHQLAFRKQMQANRNRKEKDTQFGADAFITQCSRQRTFV